MAKGAKNTTTAQEQPGEYDSQPSVYFLSLEVENILCFKDRQVLNLSDSHRRPHQWTVILGDNGVGKTTLLRCLAGMQMESKSDTGQHTYYMPLIDCESIASDWSNKVEDCSFDTEEFPLIFVALVIDGSLSSSQKKPGPYYCECEIESYLDGGSSFTFVEGFEQYLSCYGYGAVRSLGSISLGDSFNSANSVSLFHEGASLINAEEWLLQTDYAARTATGTLQKRLKKQVAQMLEILQRILPDVEEIRIAPANEETPHPRAEFLTPYGWVRLGDLGLGYRTAIAWMVDLAVRLFRRYPQSPDPLSEPAIVLVDEIDLHLHPKWQRTIMDFLTERFPNTQFIVTAHSPLVVQAAQNANIVLLRREGDRVVIDNNPEIIQNWRVDQVLTSVFELSSARPPQVESLLQRRSEILAQAHLTAQDETELQDLAERIGPIPTADTPEDIAAMDIIRRAAELLRQP